MLLIACRLLDSDPWRVLDFLHRRVAGADVAGYALCSVAHETLSVISANAVQLQATMHGHVDLLGMLAKISGNCMDILSSVALMLPAAVLQMLVSEHDGELSAPVPVTTWIVSVLEGVHHFQTVWGKYPATSAAINLINTLIKCVGLTDDLLSVTVKIVSGMGCYHTQWHLQQRSESWDMTIALLSMLQSALGYTSLCAPGGTYSNSHSRLLHALLQDGLLRRLFWVRCILSSTNLPLLMPRVMLMPPLLPKILDGAAGKHSGAKYLPQSC